MKYTGLELAALAMALLLPATLWRPSQTGEAESADVPPSELMLVYTGNVQGQLEPCG